MLACPPSFHRRAVALAVAAVLLASIAGCGSGGGSAVAVATNSSTGSVAVVVVDAATEDFEQIWVTVRKVELIGAGGQFTLFEGRHVFDLLALRDDARLLSLGREVPAGDWSKVRLQVEDVELIRVVPESEATNTVDCRGDLHPEPGFVCESITPKVPGNGKIDLNPRGPITVEPGGLV